MGLVALINVAYTVMQRYELAFERSETLAHTPVEVVQGFIQLGVRYSPVCFLLHHYISS
jgi:hypothetical protein